jgi:hypothetical protein
MIYTGNNGRIYIARQLDRGIQGSFTRDVVPGEKVESNETFSVYNVQGDGRGAVVRVASTMASNATSRSMVFDVVSRGNNYSAGDVVYFGRVNNRGTLVRITGNFKISTTATIGIDNAREIFEDKYRIAKVRSWTLNSSSEVVETTALGDAVKTFSPSITSGEGSATLMFYEDDSSNKGESAQKDTFELVDILFPRGTPPRVVLNLAVDGTATGNALDVGSAAIWKTNFLFNAYITGASVGVNYGEVVTIDTSFTIDGPLLDTPWKPGVTAL